jgi:hypothetical protein
MTPSADPADEIVIKRQALLDLYDGGHDWTEREGSPISAITGMIGEDLVLALLRDHLASRGGSQTPRYDCKGHGSWLDAWLVTPTARYQVEIKSWCASAFGGKKVKPDDSNLRQVAEKNLERYLTHKDCIKAVWKVLKPMDKTPPPDGTQPIRPLLAFWSPVARLDGTEPLPPCFFTCNTSDYATAIREAGIEAHEFEEVDVFSASLYLRSLTDESLSLPMPRAAHRLDELAKLIEIPPK